MGDFFFSSAFALMLWERDGQREGTQDSKSDRRTGACVEI